MDFGQVLHTAKKNEKSTQNGVRYYSTKFEPPKKEEKKSAQLSQNIKKFLAKKEAEERRKVEEDRKKRDELLALRSQDKKATRRVNVMLKRTKSANQSVIEDAVDNDNTAVTLVGPMQPDEDDYGYVSQEASAFYNKMMEKYSKMPDEPKFNMFKKKVSTNLSSTKDRVKAALEKEKEEALLPHKRKRKSKNKDKKADEEDDEGLNFEAPDRGEKEESPPPPPPPPKPKPKMAPPPMNFAELLKIAEKKQFEPIVIEKKEKEEERLLTKKQRKEAEREREYLQRKEERMREAERRGLPKPDSGPSRIPKIGEKSSNIEKNSKLNNNHSNVKSASSDILRKTLVSGERPTASNNTKEFNKPAAKVSSSQSSSVNYKDPQKSAMISSKDSKQKPSIDNNNRLSPRDQSLKKSQSYETKLKKPNSDVSLKKNQDSMQSKRVQFEDVKPRKYLPGDIRAKNQDIKPKQFPPPDVRPKQFPPSDVRPKQFPPSDVRPKQFPSADVRPKQFPPKDLKPKQFPPTDVRKRSLGSKKPVIGNKRRILDDDDSEYDSEMDDFIDDDEPEDDYSKHIQDIFGYDKSKYRDMDDDVDNMESSFAQQMREEVISTKIGIMEDLEDIKKEEEEKKRKALMKKRRKF